MKYYTSYTPRHWEFGFGVYLGSWHENALTEMLSRHPHEFALLFGPFSFCLTIGHYITVETTPRDKQILEGNEE